MTGPYPEAAGPFDIYKPGNAEFDSPSFVYTELFDESWCVEESEPFRCATNKKVVDVDD